MLDELLAVLDDCDLHASDSGSQLTIEAASDATSPKRVTLSPAYSGGLLHVDAAPIPVVLDLASLTIDVEATGQLPLLMVHDAKRGVGHANAADVVNNGRTLTASGVLSIPSADSEQIASAQANGFKWKSSIGAKLDKTKLQIVPAGQTLQANGQTFRGPVVFARNAVLKEISFVPLGGDSKATAKLSASRSSNMDQALVDLIASAGFKPEEVAANPTQLKHFEDAIKAAAQSQISQKRDDMQINLGDAIKAEIGDVKAALTQELNDVKALREQLAKQARYDQLDAKARDLNALDLSFKVQGKDVNLLAHAKEQNWELQHFELEVLRESRHRAPAGYVRASAASTPEALAGALMLRANLSLDAKLWNSSRDISETLNAAAGGNCFLTLDLNAAARDAAMNDAYRCRSMSMVDICRTINQMEGRNLGFDVRENVRAALSSKTLSFVFSTNFAAQMLSGWDEEADTTVGWVYENRDVPNFLKQERGRFLGQTDLEKHTKGGEAAHATASDDYEEYLIERFSRQFICDEMDIINDRFGAIGQEVPKELGRGARRVRPNLVYGILKRNPDMRDEAAWLSTTRGNLRFSSALTEANLKAALTAFRLQRELGVFCNQERPTHLLVPQTLDWTAKALINLATVSTGGQNLLFGVIENIVAEGRLDLSHTDPSTGTSIAGSTTDWFVVNGRRPPVEVGYLRGGSSVPGVTQWKTAGEHGKWEVGFSVAHDIGAKAIRTQTIQVNKAASE